MIVRCPSCRAKFRVPESKIKESGTKVRCGRCKAIFRVYPHDAAESSGVHSEVTRPGERSDAKTRPAGMHEVSRDDDGPDADLQLLGNDARMDPWAEAGDPKEEAGPEGWLDNLTLGSAEAELSAAEEHGTATQWDPGSDDRAQASEAQAHRLELMDNAAASQWEWTTGTDGNENSISLPTASEQLGLDRGATNLELAESGATPQEEGPDRRPSYSEPGPPLDLERPSRLSASLKAMSDGPVIEEPAPMLVPPEDISSLLRAAPPATNPEAEGDDSQARRDPTWSGEERSADYSGALDAVSSGLPTEVLARWLGGAIVALFVVLCFLGFVAWKNAWVLDLGNMDRMLGVAFHGYEYPPPDRQTIRVYELDGEIVEEPIDAAPVNQFGALRVESQRQSVYRTRSASRVLLIEGRVANSSESPHRRIWVSGKVFDNGELVASVTAPACSPLESEELEDIDSEGTLTDIYQGLAEQAASFDLGGDQACPFTLAIVDETVLARDLEHLTYEVGLVRAEYQDQRTAWRRVVFDRDLSARIDR